MSQSALIEVLKRASTNQQFREQLRADPDAALAGCDLTAEERAALLSRDPAQLAAVGVDARISKVDNPAYPGEPFDWGNQPWF
jgi:hypothetical protein